MTDSARALRAAIDDGPMSRFQVLAVCLCVALNMLDGYDVLVMAFTASEVAREWSLSGYALGVLLSAGLVGMAIGSLLVAPWADRYGRRAVILACLGVITFGMLLSALARQPAQLKALRVLTGVGIGGILASLNVITSEYSSRRWRSAAIGVQVTGYPIGATLGGTVAALLITSFGWRSAFLFGAIHLDLYRFPFTFAVGVALGQALHDNPRRGGVQTSFRTLPPLTATRSG